MSFSNMHVCGMCILPVLSMILMVIIRYISAVLVWILTVLVVLGSLGKIAFFFLYPLLSDWNFSLLENICLGTCKVVAVLVFLSNFCLLKAAMGSS